MLNIIPGPWEIFASDWLGAHLKGTSGLIKTLLWEQINNCSKSMLKVYQTAGNRSNNTQTHRLLLEKIIKRN